MAKMKKLGVNEIGAQSPEAVAKRKEMFLHIYSNNGYNIAAAARKLGLQRSAPLIWAKHDEDFQQKLHDVRSEVVYIAEGIITKHLEEGCLETAKWVINKLGHKIGYQNNMNQININNTNVGDIVIEGISNDGNVEIIDVDFEDIEE